MSIVYVLSLNLNCIGLIIFELTLIGPTFTSQKLLTHCTLSKKILYIEQLFYVLSNLNFERSKE